MRISDWSSDVCSSDLGDIRQQNGELVPAEPCGKRALGVHAAFAFGVDHDAQARSDNAQKLVADMMAQRVVDRFELVQVDEDQRVARAVVRGGIQLPFGLPPQMKEVGKPRHRIVHGKIVKSSEEHQSALQSLMRISYAVLS